MSGQAVRAGKAFWELGVKDKLDAGLKAAAAKLKTFSVGLTAAGAGLAAAGGLLTAPLGLALRSFQAAGSAVDDMSKRTGMSAAAITELSYAAAQSGTDIDTLEKASLKMSKAIVDASDGSSTAAAALAKLGTSAEELINLTPDQQLAKLADGLATITNPTEKAAAAMDIFGKSGTQLLPLLADGSAGLEAMRGRARALGLSMSDEAAGSAAALDDSLAEMRGTIGGLTNAVGAALAPTITDLATRATSAIAIFSRWATEHKSLILMAGKLAVGMTAIGGAMTGLGAAGFGISKALPYLKILAPIISAVASPIGLVVGGLALAGAAFLRYSAVGQAAWRAISAGAQALYALVAPTLEKIAGLLSSGDFAGAAETAWQAILSAAQPVIDALAEAWTGLTIWLMDLWNMIPAAARDGLAAILPAALEALEPLGALFSKLGTIATETFGGIADALTGGQWALAGQIAWTGLKAAFLTGMAAIEKPWLEFTTGLMMAFDWAITGIRRVWTSVSTWIAEQLLTIFGAIQKAAAALGIELAPGLNVDQAIKALHQDKARTMAGLDAARASRDEARARQLSTDLADTQRALAELETQRKALNSDAAKTAAEAATLKAGPSLAPAGGGPGIPKRPDLAALLAGADLATASAGAAAPSAAGTFSAAAAMMLAGPDDRAERTANATERTAKATEKIAKETKAATWKA